MIAALLTGAAGMVVVILLLVWAASYFAPHCPYPKVRK